MKKLGWPMLYVFLIKPFKQGNFGKTSSFFGRVFPQKIYRFSMEAIQN